MRLRSAKLLAGLMDVHCLTNADVALAAGVSRTFISALVNGRRSSCTPGVAKAIARCLNTPLANLFAPTTSRTSGQNVPVRVPSQRTAS